MKLRERLNQNRLNVKLISFVMAVFLWSYVMGIVNPEIDQEYRGIEVKFAGTEYLQREGLSFLSPQNPKVSVRIKGTRSDHNNIKTENIYAEANLSGVRPGENVVSVRVTIQEQSGRLNVVNIDPAQIVVNIDEIVTENLEISVATLGELPEGYTLGNVRVVNNFVRVTAPRSVINQIEKVVVYPVITDKTETFMINSPITFLDKNDNEMLNLNSNVSTADIEVPIYRLKSVPIRPLVTGTIGQDEKITNIRVEPENIVIRGSTEVIESINSIQTESVVLQDLVGSESHEVELQLPEGVSLHDPNIDIKLKYEYINNVQKTINIPKENFYINNKNSNLSYAINTEFDNISIVLYGESSLLEELSGENIKTFVDVKGLSPGEYVLELNIESINDVTLRSITPVSLEVVITNSVDEAVTPSTNGATPPVGEGEVNEVNDDNE